MAIIDCCDSTMCSACVSVIYVAACRQMWWHTELPSIRAQREHKSKKVLISYCSVCIHILFESKKSL